MFQFNVQVAAGYQRITDQDRGGLIDAFENNNTDYLAVADTLGIKHAITRSNVANYLPTGRCEKLTGGMQRMEK